MGKSFRRVSPPAESKDVEHVEIIGKPITRPGRNEISNTN